MPKKKLIVQEVYVPWRGLGPTAGHEPRAADGALHLQDQEEVLQGHQGTLHFKDIDLRSIQFKIHAV